MDDSCEQDSRERIIRLEERLSGSEKALVLAREEIAKSAYEMDKRLEGMNEFRLQLNAQAATFISRKEMDLILERLSEDKRSSVSMWISLVALMGVFVNLMIGLFKQG